MNQSPMPARYAPQPVVAPQQALLPALLIAALGICTALPLLQRLLWSWLPPASTADELAFMEADLIGVSTSAIGGLLHFATFVLLLVWTYRAVKGLRGRSIETVFSPALAVGSWFIPIGNLLMPMLAMRDVWKKATQRYAAVVYGWWFAFIVSMFLQAILIIDRVPLHHGEASSHNLFWVGWLVTLSTVAAWSLLLVIVGTASRALRA